MNSNQTVRHSSDDKSDWPLRTMLLFGTFGTGTPAERRFIVRSMFASALALGWTLFGLITGFRPRPLMIDVLVLLAPLVITYACWESWKYVVTLDELARHILFEAAVRAYGAATLVAVWISGVAVVVRWPRWSHYWHPKVVLFVALYLFVLLVLILHGFYVRRVARRY